MKMPCLVLLEKNKFNVYVKALRAIALKGPSNQQKLFSERLIKSGVSGNIVQESIAEA